MAAEENWRNMTCIKVAWRGHNGWMAAAAGIFIGLVLYFNGADYLASRQPTVSVVQDLTVVVMPGDAVNRDLRVTITAPTPHNCWRMSQQLLYRDDPDGHRTFFPLGSALNGRGFTASVQLDGTYHLVISLPSYIQTGRYKFIQRSMYHCTWLWDMIARDITFETAPIPVEIDT